MSTLEVILSKSQLSEVFAFIFGIMWGSFYNVCIYRIPLEQSVITKRSYCPSCKKGIPGYLNIPLFSFLMLRGKCYFCHKRISIQYPIVEFLTGVLFVWNWLMYGWTAAFFAYTLFGSILIVISVIDFHHKIIPDELSLPGIVLGFLCALIVRDISWLSSLFGILLGGGIFWLIAYFYERASGREGLGGGDVKLLAMIGAWLGADSILLVIVISSAFGSVVGLSTMAIQKKDFKAAIPFGPFLALAAIIYLYWGDQIQPFFQPKP